MPTRRSLVAPAALALAVDELLEVLRLLELLSAIPRAVVRGDHVGAIDYADLVEVREDDQGALGPVVRDRIVVEIEANIGCLADLNFDALVDGEWIVGQ